MHLSQKKQDGPGDNSGDQFEEDMNSLYRPVEEEEEEEPPESEQP